MRFECIKCGYRLLFDLDNYKEDISKCPQCFSQTWQLIKNDDNDESDTTSTTTTEEDKTL